MTMIPVLLNENTRLDREPPEYIINYRYIKQYLPEKAHILDNGAGHGKYSKRLEIDNCKHEKKGDLSITSPFAAD